MSIRNGGEEFRNFVPESATMNNREKGPFMDTINKGLLKPQNPEFNKELAEGRLTYHEIIISGSYEEKLKMMVDCQNDSSKKVICYGDMGDGTIKVLFGDLPKKGPETGWETLNYIR